MSNYAEFYKAFTESLASYAKAERLDAERDYSEFEDTLNRKYEEGFSDAMRHAFILITGSEPDEDEFETSCEDFHCDGTCESNYCDSRSYGIQREED